MAKFLIWAVIILAVLMVIRILNFKKSLERNLNNQANKQKNLESEEMVRCAHCQIYLPRSEAYMSQGKTWCCAEHAQLGLKK